MLPSFWEILPDIIYLILEIAIISIVLGVAINRITKNYFYSNIAVAAYFYLALGLVAFDLRVYAFIILLLLLAVKNIITITMDLNCKSKIKNVNNGIRTKNKFNNRSIYRLSK